MRKDWLLPLPPIIKMKEKIVNELVCPNCGGKEFFLFGIMREKIIKIYKCKNCGWPVDIKDE